MPAADALRGRGLAIVERVCDAVAVSTVPGGTLVRVRLDL
jgi:anti-sigma regulatory factor (Ser/Thr protein kinase)